MSDQEKNIKDEDLDDVSGGRGPTSAGYPPKSATGGGGTVTDPIEIEKNPINQP
ncbi:MAG: hypothetical protein JO104_07910 [Candidatus Eremiobacteraeota bacterium]|nr:hypothetical protein [Candidatus Eremiobacteraeota bacterium]